MKKHIILTLFFAMYSQTIFAQTSLLDSIFTNEGIILANVKKVSPEEVEYSLPNEEIITAIYKNTVKKIRFKSGRLQIFTGAIALNSVNSALDFRSVYLTRLESETMGMLKIDDVELNIVEPRVNSSNEKNRFFQKVKIISAMLGGNLLYIIDKTTVNNQWRGQLPMRNTTTVSGVSYTNRLPKMEELKAIIKDKKAFPIYQTLYMGKNGDEIKYGKVEERSLEIENIYEENNFIYINAKGFENVLLRVVSFDESQIVLVWKDADRNRIYNIFLKL